MWTTARRIATLPAVLTVLSTACTASDNPITAASRSQTSSPAGSPSPERASSSPGPSGTATPTPLVSPSESEEGDIPVAVLTLEDTNQLAIVGPSQDSPCPTDRTACAPLQELRRMPVAAGPHNLAASGSTVLATHPAAGTVTRLDLATDEVVAEPVGYEPHDVAFSPDGAVAYVSDEGGRRLLVLDPISLATRAEVALPAQPHDLAVDDGDVWVTLDDREELARVRDGRVELIPTGRSPHDLIFDAAGRLWFSNWNSAELTILDPQTGGVSPAPMGDSQPHHFALAADGTVWMSDNEAGEVVAFSPTGPVAAEVGAAPHHLSSFGAGVVVAVSGAGQAVVVEAGRVAGRIPLDQGLHDVVVTQVARTFDVGG